MYLLRRCRIYHTLILWVSLSTVATCVMIRISPFSFSTRKQLLNWIIHFCLFIVCLKYFFTFYHGTVNHHETTIWGILRIHPPFFWTPEKKSAASDQAFLMSERRRCHAMSRAPSWSWWMRFLIVGNVENSTLPGNKMCVSCGAEFFCFPKGVSNRRFCCWGILK